MSLNKKRVPTLYVELMQDTYYEVRTSVNYVWRNKEFYSGKLVFIEVVIECIFFSWL